MTPQELLLKAAEEIGRTGLFKKNYSEPDVSEQIAPVCAYGAMTRAATNGAITAYPLMPQEDADLVDQAAALLAKHVGPQPYDTILTDYSTVTRFNDNDKTTGEDVILAMKKAGSA